MTQVAAIHSQRSEPCCTCGAKKVSWLQQVELICRIALGIFALTLAFLPMAISLSLGFTAGAAYAATEYIKKHEIFPEGKDKPVCAQGYMDFLSGMRFPPLIGSVATATFIGAHMRHDPVFYVPFCGLFLGFWLGHEAAALTTRSFTKFQKSLAQILL